MEFRQQVFNSWAPNGSVWSQYAKPVIFYSIEEQSQTGGTLYNTPISYMAAGQTDTAIILDIPGAQAVAESISLAKLGFRPVPLFNGNSVPNNARGTGNIELVDTASIKAALILGAEQLANIPLPTNAPPVFLLDSHRLDDILAAPNMFDNRWNLYAHDLPSADYFKRAGIKRIILRNNQGEVFADLAPILFELQKSGIEIFVQQIASNIQSQEQQMPQDFQSPQMHIHSHTLHPIRINIRQPGFFARLFGRRTYRTRSWNSTGGWGSSRPCHGYGGRYGGGYRGGGYSGGVG